MSVVRTRLQAPLPLQMKRHRSPVHLRASGAVKWPKFRLGNCISVTWREATFSCRRYDDYGKIRVQPPDCCRCEGEKKLCGLDAKIAVRQRVLTAFLLAGRGYRDIVSWTLAATVVFERSLRGRFHSAGSISLVVKFHYRDGRLTRSVSWVPRVRPKQELANNAR